MIKVDLHIHSNFSDGQYSPEKIINFVHKKNISIFSLIDHNFILDDTNNIKKIAKDKDLTFIEGIEISCLEKESKMSFHVLGYSCDFNKSTINNKLKPTVDGYNNRAKKIISKLNIEFPSINLNFENIKGESSEIYVSRNTLARIIVNYFKNKISIKEALKKICFC